MRDALGGGVYISDGFVMTIAWRWRLVGPFVISVIAVSAGVLIKVLTGPVPDEWWYALAVYVGGVFGFPWSLMLGGWWLFSGLLINAAALFVIGWVVETRGAAT